MATHDNQLSAYDCHIFDHSCNICHAPSASAVVHGCFIPVASHTAVRPALIDHAPRLYAPPTIFAQNLPKFDAVLAFSQKSPHSISFCV